MREKTASMSPEGNLSGDFSNCHLEIRAKPCWGWGAKYLLLFSSRSPKLREKCISFVQLVLLSLYMFWGKCVYFSISEWWNSQLFKKKNIIVKFIIQKLKSKHTSLKKYTNWAKLINPAHTYKFQLKTTKDRFR